MSYFLWLYICLIIRNTNLTKANLTNANLQIADLKDAKGYGWKVEKTDFT
ncbi:MAG: pentapeptide repeat-containing protein [Cyanobacteria bacterium P01_H01_bin.35]